MSEKKVNIIIVFVVIITLIVAALLMYYSPKRNHTVNTIKEVDKITVVNETITNSFKNNSGHFTVNLSNYKLNDKTINLNINVKKNKDSSYQIENILLDDYTINISSKKMIDFKIGTIKENNNDILLYINTISGSPDGEGDVIIINNNGNILYRNSSAYIQELDDEKYLIKEKYCDVLSSLICNSETDNDIAFKNITYKSINAQLVNIDYKELFNKDICYSE